jgi:hypothetical protein
MCYCNLKDVVMLRRKERTAGAYVVASDTSRRYEVVKVNKWGKKQRRILTVDDKRRCGAGAPSQLRTLPGLGVHVSLLGVRHCGCMRCGCVCATVCSCVCAGSCEVTTCPCI